MRGAEFGVAGGYGEDLVHKRPFAPVPSIPREAFCPRRPMAQLRPPYFRLWSSA